MRCSVVNNSRRDKVSATTHKTCTFEDVDDVVPVFSKMLTQTVNHHLRERTS